MTGSGEFSRRRMLAAVAGVSAFGAVAGAGTVRTYAYLSDRQRLDGLVSSGNVSLSVDCADCVDDENGVSVAFEDLDRGDSGQTTLEISVDTNPARLWLRTNCPPVDDPLGEDLQVTLRDGADDVLADGSLTAVREELAAGLRLDDLDGDTCTDPGVPVPIQVEWAVPADADDDAENAETALTFSLFAEQCRHVPEDGVQNPYADADPCPEPDPECVHCPNDDGERIAGATFAYDGPDGTDLSIDRAGQGANQDTVFSGIVDDGTEFTVALHDPPDVKGGPDFGVIADGEEVGEFHTSCSEPFGPGLVISDGTYSLTVVSAVDTDGSRLCEVSTQ